MFLDLVFWFQILWLFAPTLSWQFGVQPHMVGKSKYTHDLRVTIDTDNALRFKHLRSWKHTALSCCCSFCQLAMAPKKTAKDKEATKEAKAALFESAEKKKAQSLAVTNAKNAAKSPDVAKAAQAQQWLDHYNSLARFSAEKLQMVEKHKQDKSFYLVTSVTKDNETKDESKVDGAKGFGSKCPPVTINLLMPLGWFYWLL